MPRSERLQAVPQRSDLIAAVMQTSVDACAEAASILATKYGPGEALARWLHRLMDFFGTKRGLAAALHSGDIPPIALCLVIFATDPFERRDGRLRVGYAYSPSSRVGAISC